jgi:hypothetical protein
MDEQVASCEVMVAPFDRPSAKATDTRPPGIIVTLMIDGESGAERGVTGLETLDGELVSPPLLAVTENV